MALPTLGIIGGSAFLDGTGLADAVPRTVRTSWGDVTVHEADRIVAIRRHGDGTYRPPHRIPHQAHVTALHELGVRHAVGFASAGSLRESLRPGTVIVPEDYIAMHPPPTFAADEYLHIVPRLDAEVRALLRDAAGAAGAGAVDDGVYVQTRGPRFETAAEGER
jgi:5'-methylthioadenosine phosphorylase